jgi:hypothetical protein
MSDFDTELGPVDYLVVAFPAGKADFSGDMASELTALMDSGTVRRAGTGPDVAHQGPGRVGGGR